MKTFLSWNVNGIRAVSGKGFFEWMETQPADFISIQETKAQREQLGPEFMTPGGYKSWWAQADKKGYSGVALYTKEEPLNVQTMGYPEFDGEGRFLAAEYSNFIFVGAYFPNSQEAGARLGYKLDFCQAMLEWTQTRQSQGKEIIVCGDYNIAHQPIDLARPKQNEGNPGYLPEERAWMEKFINLGWTDTFRHLHPTTQEFSWWSYRFQAKVKNIGWRIDYHCVTPGLKGLIRQAAIHPQIEGSDHVPVTLSLEI